MRKLIAAMLAALLLATAIQAADPVQARCGTLTVKGMVCSSCSTAVKKALTALPGVGDVTVDIKKDLVTVTYDQRKITLPQMINAVRKAGFKAELPK